MASHTSLNLVIAALAVAVSCAPEPAGDQLSVRQPSQAQPRASTTPPSAPPSPSPDTVPLDSVLARARSGSEESRAQAVFALAKPGARLEERLRTLAAALRDTNRRVGLTAAAALAKLAPASVPTLLTALADHNPDTRRRAVFALGKSKQGDTVTIALHDALSDPDQSVRDMAAWASTQRHPRASSGAGAADLGTTADLRAGLSAPDPNDRLSAIQRYQPFADSDPHVAIQLLIKALGDGDAGVRSGAADALVIIGPASRTQLTAALSDPNPAIRREASVALVRLGRGGP